MNDQSTSELDFIKGLLIDAIRAADAIPKPALNLWFAHLKIESISDSTAILAVENEFISKKIQERYADVLADYLSEIVGYRLFVQMSVDETLVPAPRGGTYIRPFNAMEGKMPEADDDEDEDEEEEEDAPRTVGDRNSAEEKKEQSANGDRRLDYNPDYTFDNFVVGESNMFAHSMAKYVSKHPAKKYNPLFIYGPPGVGKTHLMYAITNNILLDNPNANITYIKGEDFTNKLVEAINKKQQEQFRNKYRKVDALLIDDVQFIAGKNSSQEELFHTFNTLYEEHKQIILTSDRPPKDLPGLEDRIRSRFEGGVLADISLPDYELRLAILKNKAKSVGLELSDEIEKFLAEKLDSNIRQIEGVIKKLSGIAFLSRDPLTIETVRRSVPEYLRENEPVGDTVKRVVRVCAKYYNVTPEDILGEKRDKYIRLARNASMYIIKQMTDLSFPAIGEYFGQKHYTVISNCNTVREMMNADPVYSAEVEEMMRESHA